MQQAIGAQARLGQGTGTVYRVVADGGLVAAVNGDMHGVANPS
jgi:hypothetical protein